MRDKRRRRIYVDRVFQKRMILLYLGLNLLIVIANLIYYSRNLRALLEANLYRSHIEISNLTEVISENVIRFNLMLAALSLILAIVFYAFIRQRTRLFFSRLTEAMHTRMSRTSGEWPEVNLSREFQEFDVILKEFFLDVDNRSRSDLRRISSLRVAYQNLIESP
jgi:hypothetical protein